MNIIDRLKSKMSVPNENGCVLFIGAKSPTGYGKITVGSRLNGTKSAKSAHRLSYELFVGPIPNGQCVLHQCDVRACINPNHLFLGTQSDNMKDMIKKGRCVKVGSPGSKHPQSKLNEEKVKEIKEKLNKGMRCFELGKEYCVTPETIGYIKNGNTWKHVI